MSTTASGVGHVLGYVNVNNMQSRTVHARLWDILLLSCVTMQRVNSCPAHQFKRCARSTEGTTVSVATQESKKASSHQMDRSGTSSVSLTSLRLLVIALALLP